MALMTVVAGALSILKATGLDEKLGSLIFGEKGAEVAGKIVSVAQGVTGATDLSTVVDDLNKDNDLAHAASMALMSQETELYKLALADRADARAMQTAALNQGDQFARRFIYYFAWFWSCVSAATIFIMLLYPIPEANIRFADTMQGFILGTVVATMLGYFFGAMFNPNSKAAGQTDEQPAGR